VHPRTTTHPRDFRNLKNPTIFFPIPKTLSKLGDCLSKEREREREREREKKKKTHTHTHLLPNFLPPMQCSPRYRKDVAKAAEAASQKTSRSLLVLFDPKSLRK